MHYSDWMRLVRLQRIFAGIAAAALLGSGGAQALLLHRCGSEMVMKSCCCEKGDAAAPRPARFEQGDKACCSISAPPVQRDDATPQATPAQSAPVTVSVAFAVLPAPAVPVTNSRFAVTESRSAGPPVLDTTCSLLI
jgi:hypothetical protein